MKAKNVWPQRTKVRTSRYLSNLIEQDQRKVKQRIYAMPGFKRLQNAIITISGIELMDKIRKGQFETSKVVQSNVRAPQLWAAVLCA